MLKPSRVKFILFDITQGEFAPEHKAIQDRIQQDVLPQIHGDTQDDLAHLETVVAQFTGGFSPAQSRRHLRAAVEQYVHYIPQGKVELVHDDYHHGSNYSKLQSHLGYAVSLIKSLITRNLTLTDDDFSALLAFIVKCPNLHPGASPSGRLITLIKRRFAGNPVPQALRDPMLAFAKALLSYSDNPCHRLGVELTAIANNTTLAPAASPEKTNTSPPQLQFKSGPVLTTDDIQKLKELVGFPIPQSYERFLLATNGRIYNQDVVLKNPAGKRLTGSSIKLFNLKVVTQQYQQLCSGTGRDTFPRYVLPVGNVGQDSLGTLFLCLADWHFGSVWNIDWGHEGEPGHPVGDPDVENPILIGACHGHAVVEDFQQLIDAITSDKSGGYGGSGGGNASRLTGRKLSRKNLETAQTDHAIKLPDDYADYLLKSNGGGLGDNSIPYLGQPKRSQLIYWLLPFINARPGNAAAIDCARSLGKHCNLPPTLLPIACAADNNLLLLSLDAAALGHIYAVDWQSIRQNPALWNLVKDHASSTPNPALWAALEAQYKVADSFAQLAQTLKPKTT